MLSTGEAHTGLLFRPERRSAMIWKRHGRPGRSELGKTRVLRTIIETFTGSTHASWRVLLQGLLSTDSPMTQTPSADWLLALPPLQALLFPLNFYAEEAASAMLFYHHEHEAWDWARQFFRLAWCLSLKNFPVTGYNLIILFEFPCQKYYWNDFMAVLSIFFNKTN